MASEAQPQAAAGAVLSPRAGLAMLTLQLRSALQEAVAAEAAESSLDEHAARAELRDRLAPLLAERRSLLENELTAVREEAAAKVAAARRAAEVMITKASAPPPPSAPTVVEQMMAPLPAPPVPEPLQVVESLQVVEPLQVVLPPLAAEPSLWAEPSQIAESVQVEEPGSRSEQEPDGLVPLDQLMATFGSRDEPPVSAFQELPTAVPASALPSLPVLHAPAAPVNIGIDSEAFARVFAAVFATMLDERLAGTPLMPHHQPATWVVPPPPPAPAKKGFWASALHVDVMLLGAAMVIMLVVLAAWLA